MYIIQKYTYPIFYLTKYQLKMINTDTRVQEWKEKLTIEQKNIINEKWKISIDNTDDFYSRIIYLDTESESESNEFSFIQKCFDLSKDLINKQLSDYRMITTKLENQELILEHGSHAFQIILTKQENKFIYKLDNFDKDGIKLFEILTTRAFISLCKYHAAIFNVLHLENEKQIINL